MKTAINGSENKSQQAHGQPGLKFRTMATCNDTDHMKNGSQSTTASVDLSHNTPDSINCDSEPMIDETEQSAASAAGVTQVLAAAEKQRVKQVMLERLACSGAHFAHQQRDSPDLTQQQKWDIAEEILLKNPATFLSRFGKYLHPSDLAFFNDVDKDNYEVQFHLKEIQHRCAHSDLIVKNRRYMAMKELEAVGEYFSEDAMKRREPLLYEQMVGQFLTEEEQEQQASAAINRSDLRLSTVLLTHMDDIEEKAIYKYQKQREECQEEEEEDSDDEEEDDDDDNKQQQRKKADVDEDDSEAESVPEIADTRATDIWRQQLHEEFTAIMHEKFLSGEDPDFDYSKVDENPDYDSLLTLSQDEENKYFQAEEAYSVGLNDSDKDSEQSAPVAMEEEEEDDYMLYEPSADLVAKSAHFVKVGSWNDDADDKHS